MATRIYTMFNTLKVASMPSCRRTIATAPKKFEFIALIPDKPGAREKRLSVRAQHFKELGAKTETGAWKMGGAILKSIPESDDPTTFDFQGSAVISVAESKEQVIEQLKTDVYHTAGVWDTEKAQIIPYLNGFRTP